jgi:hypothetical protein
VCGPKEIKMLYEKKIRSVLKDALTNTCLGSYVLVNHENSIAPKMPTGIPLRVVGTGMGSVGITYKNVVGWDDVGEDDRYLILKVPGSIEGSPCYAMMHHHPHDVFINAYSGLLERLTEDIMYECDLPEHE